MQFKRNERGAAAVEFAIVVPFLLVLVFGIVEFSRIYNAQISLSQAAREGARTMAVKNDVALARQAVDDGAPSLVPAISSAGTVSISPGTCTGGQSVKVVAQYDFPLLTGIVGTEIKLVGEGVMQCGG